MVVDSLNNSPPLPTKVFMKIKADFAFFAALFVFEKALRLPTFLENPSGKNLKVCNLKQQCEIFPANCRGYYTKSEMPQQKMRRIFDYQGEVLPLSRGGGGKKEK